MDVYRFWRVLVSHKWLIILLPIIATLVGLGVTYALPEQYESTALVLVRPYQDIKFNSTGGDKRDLLDLPVNLSAPIDAPSKTYIEVIKSPAVAVKIVEALHLDVKPPRIYESTFDRIKDEVKTWFSETMRTSLNYLKYGRDIPASPFERAVEDVEKKLVVTPKKDTFAFEIAYRSGNPEEAAAVANTASAIFLEQRSEAYRRDSVHAREFIAAQLEASRKALAEARAATLGFKNAGNTFELKSEYTEKLKMVSDLQDTLAKTLGKMSGLRRTFPNGSTNLIGQEAEIAELRAQISSAQAELVGYPKKENLLNALTLTEGLAEDSYKFFLKQDEEARVKEASNVTEIRIASPAEPGLYPLKPVKYLYALLSFATALVVAIGWALCVEALSPRIRTIRDLDVGLDLPVLGVIPTLRRSRLTVGT